MAAAYLGHPKAPGSGGRPQPAAATPGDRDEDMDVSPIALLTPAQSIAVAAAGMGGTAHSTLPSPTLLMGFFPPSCLRAPAAPLETHTHHGNRHCPLLSTLWFLVMNDTSLSKKEDIFAIKVMVRNT